MHSIFKIRISRNMKCAYMVGFIKYSHISFQTRMRARRHLEWALIRITAAHEMTCFKF